MARKESDIIPFPTIRHVRCELLCISPAERCAECTRYRKTLRANCSKQSRQTTLRIESSSHVNHRYLTKDELKERLQEVHRRERTIAKKFKRLSVKIAASIEKDGINVDNVLHEDVKQVMEHYGDEILSKHPPDSFPHIFWKQQLQSASLPNARQRRWHPLMIKWALYLRHLSGKAYNTLQQSGVLALPSQRTLRDYTYFVESTLGFSNAVDTQLMEVSKFGELQDFQKCVAVVLDEMHIKKELVFSKHSGDLIGFCNLGPINDLLLRYERSLESDAPSSSLLAINQCLCFL